MHEPEPNNPDHFWVWGRQMGELTSTSGHQEEHIFASQCGIDGLLLVWPEGAVPEDVLIEAPQLFSP